MGKKGEAVSNGLSREDHARALRACVDLLEWKGNIELCIDSVKCDDPIHPFNVMKEKVMSDLDYIEETIQFLTQHITEIAVLTTQKKQ